MFSCDICNYQTNKKWNYQKHCESKRHQRNLEKSITNSNKSITNSNKSITNSNKYKCIDCNSEFKRIDNYNKHLNKCSIRLIKLVEEKESEINKLKEKNKQLIENQKEEINTLTNELNYSLKLNQEYQLKVKDTEIRCLKEIKQISISNNNNNNNNRTNITQYIINKYPNAKNVWVPDEVSGLENYASDKVEENVNKLLTSIYKKNVEPKDRPIWCIDSSRQKYLTRLDNLWHVDLYGLLFCEKVCKQLAERCNKYINGIGKSKINVHDKIRSMCMINDLLMKKKLTGPIKGQFIINCLENDENDDNEENDEEQLE